MISVGSVAIMNTEPRTEQAVCRNQWDRYDDQGGRGGRSRREHKAELEACTHCPVLNQCRAFVLKVPPYDGIWAGEIIPPGAKTTTARHIVFARIADALGVEYLPPTQPDRSLPEISHGTAAGYRAHLRRDITMCEDCRSAGLAYAYERRRA